MFVRIETILSVTTGKLFAEIKDVGAFIVFMCGRDVPLILRDQVVAEIRLDIFCQFAELQGVVLPVRKLGQTGDDYKEEVLNDWLAGELEAGNLSAMYTIAPLSADIQKQLEKIIDELPPESKLLCITKQGYSK